MKIKRRWPKWVQWIELEQVHEASGDPQYLKSFYLGLRRRERLGLAEITGIAR